MKTKRLIWCFALMISVLAPAIADEGIYGRSVKKVNLPNLDGFVTLQGDFHIHTIYSDGWVLPEVRVNEIYREGMTAMAITDHAESSPIVPELPKNSNRANELAQKRADEVKIVFAKGTEITRDFRGDDFSAHFVALFVNDVNRIEVPDTIDMVREAKKQGAFVFWAHPWEAGPEVWNGEIEAMLKEGLIDGVEIMNEGWYSEETFLWGMKNNLTIMGNTDAHNPIFYGRPSTLIFAKARTADAMKEALFDRRTVVFNGSTLYGKEKFLSEIFYKSVAVKSQNIAVSATAPGKLIFANSSDVNFRIILDKTGMAFDMRKEIIIEANKDTYINVSNVSAKPGTYQVTLKFANANMYCETGKNPIMQLPITVTFK